MKLEHTKVEESTLKLVEQLQQQSEGQWILRTPCPHLENQTDMTNEQINAAIAEACGWKSKEETDGKPWLWVRIRKDRTTESRMDPLHYCNDLNAMHQAEEILVDEIAAIYAQWLSKTTGAEWSDDKHFFCATARQRAEAFLRTLGLWEETQMNDEPEDQEDEPLTIEQKLRIELAWRTLERDRALADVRDLRRRVNELLNV